jgi:hypothetical protein
MKSPYSWKIYGPEAEVWEHDSGTYLVMYWQQEQICTRIDLHCHFFQLLVIALQNL